MHNIQIEYNLNVINLMNVNWRQKEARNMKQFFLCEEIDKEHKTKLTDLSTKQKKKIPRTKHQF